MKFANIGEPGKERPYMQDSQGNWRDISGLCHSIGPAIVSDDEFARFQDIDLGSYPVLEDQNPRFGPCVLGVSKLIAIGLNYSDHAAETGSREPREPIVFMKATSSISGADDPIELPRGSNHTDWEVELGVVIGKRAKYVEQSNALDHVAGYCVLNDVSERDYQKNRSGQWVKGKSFDSFGPIGPWLVSRDEVPDPQNLALSLSVNDQIQQNGHTSNMIFPVDFLVAYLSQFMTLCPGDVIATGTPAGVGLGKTPPQFLQKGDRVALQIEGLGRQTHMVV